MDGLCAGRIVHFVPEKFADEDDTEPLRHIAALVADVIDAETGHVELKVFWPTRDLAYNGEDAAPREAVYRETPAVGTWHWIERA